METLMKTAQHRLLSWGIGCLTAEILFTSPVGAQTQKDHILFLLKGYEWQLQAERFQNLLSKLFPVDFPVLIRNGSSRQPEN